MFYSNEIVQTSRNSSFDPLLNPVCASGTHLPRCLHQDRGGVGMDVLVTRVSVPAALTYLGACTRIGVGLDGMYW